VAQVGVAAAELNDEAARQAFLDRECGGDEQLLHAARVGGHGKVLRWSAFPD
jgi:hypothetical protein